MTWKVAVFDMFRVITRSILKMSTWNFEHIRNRYIPIHQTLPFNIYSCFYLHLFPSGFFTLNPSRGSIYPPPPEISAPVIARITKFGGKGGPMVNSLWCNFHDLGSISSRSNDVEWYGFCNSNVDLPILLIISTVIARNKTKIRIGRQLKQKLYFSIFWNFQIKILKIRDNQRRRHDIGHWCLFLNAFWIKRQHSEAS